MGICLKTPGRVEIWDRAELWVSAFPLVGKHWPHVVSVTFVLLGASAELAWILSVHYFRNRSFMLTLDFSDLALQFLSFLTRPWAFAFSLKRALHGFLLANMRCQYYHSCVARAQHVTVWDCDTWPDRPGGSQVSKGCTVWVPWTVIHKNGAHCKSLWNLHW